MYAIKNKRTGKWVYGTDYRYVPHRQRTSFDEAMTFDSKEEAAFAFEHRNCGKDYVIVEVELLEVNK